MPPVTICPWFGCVNDDAVQLQGKLFILSKMSSVFQDFFSINMNYTLNRKQNKYSSLFDKYLCK